MATRSLAIAAGSAVDLTAGLALVAGKSYLIEISSQSDDAINLALGDDPEVVGGHAIFASEPGRLIRQGADTWFGRFYALDGRSATLTATEADGC